MTPKQRAAHAAVPFIKSGMTVGLGTGSTADCFLDALGDELRAGRLRDIRGVATSQASQRKANELHIPLLSLDEAGQCDIVVDGADEVDAELNAIKGLGGALLREKIVAQNSARIVIIADTGKRVNYLGEKCPLPVEVLPFGHKTQVGFFRSLGAEPTLRLNKAGETFVSDNGNYIYDCRFPANTDFKAVQIELMLRAGVVETGLFMQMIHVVLLADDAGVHQLTRD